MPIVPPCRLLFTSLAGAPVRGADRGYNCGVTAAGCGGFIDWGSCPAAGQVCGSGVTCLVDVRSLPRSRTNPQFNLDVLSETLRGVGITYVHLATLGGLAAKASAFNGRKTVAPVSIYAMRVRAAVGALAVTLGGVNALVFTALWCFGAGHAIYREAIYIMPDARGTWRASTLGLYRYAIRFMPQVRNIRAAEYRALAELRYQIRCFLNFSEIKARAAKIDSQQHQLLLVLKGLCPPQKPTIRTVAERLQIQHNSAVELVQRSVERKLVERGTDPDDRREASLRITAHGERVLRSLTLAHQAELRAAAPLLVRSLEALVGDDGTKNGKRKR